MKILQHNFKSLKVESVEEISLTTGLTKHHLEFRPDTVMDHNLSLKPGNILFNTVWIYNFFLSLMIIAAVSGLAYGALTIGMNINFSSIEGAVYKTVFTVSSVIFFLILWCLLSIPAAVKNIKNSHVRAARGKGTWKIIDTNDWDAFFRLLQISQQKKDNQKSADTRI